MYVLARLQREYRRRRCWHQVKKQPQLHRLKQAAGGIGLYKNGNKTEFLSFKQEGASEISWLVHIPRQQYIIYWKLCQHAQREGVNRLSIVWQSVLIDQIKRYVFQAVARLVLSYRCTTLTLTKRLEKKLDGNYTRIPRADL